MAIDKRIAIFPGTFDPFTLGHLDILNRAIKLFDKVIIGIGINSDKKPLFDTKTRINLIKQIIKDYPNVIVKAYKGYTVNFAIRNNARYIIRGIRNEKDATYEINLADTNKKLNKNIDTVFLMRDFDYRFISSTYVKEKFKNNEDISKLVPKQILSELNKIKY